MPRPGEFEVRPPQRGVLGADQGVGLHEEARPRGPRRVAGAGLRRSPDVERPAHRGRGDLVAKWTRSLMNPRGPVGERYRPLGSCIHAPRIKTTGSGRRTAVEGAATSRRSASSKGGRRGDRDSHGPEGNGKAGCWEGERPGNRPRPHATGGDSPDRPDCAIISVDFRSTDGEMGLATWRSCICCPSGIPPGASRRGRGRDRRAPGHDDDRPRPGGGLRRGHPLRRDRRGPAGRRRPAARLGPPGRRAPRRADRGIRPGQLAGRLHARGLPRARPW